MHYLIERIIKAYIEDKKYLLTLHVNLEDQSWHENKKPDENFRKELRLLETVYIELTIIYSNYNFKIIITNCQSCTVFKFVTSRYHKEKKSSEK